MCKVLKVLCFETTSIYLKTTFIYLYQYLLENTIQTINFKKFELSFIHEVFLLQNCALLFVAFYEGKPELF